MKFLFSFLFAAILFSACEKKDLQVQPEPLAPCLQQKIDDFKLDPSAESIIRIDRPGDTLYWFVDTIIDGFEEVANANCTFICVTDCDCITEHGCEPDIFNFPQEILWEK